MKGGETGSDEEAWPRNKAVKDPECNDTENNSWDSDHSSTLQSPTYSCGNPVIPVESTGIYRNDRNSTGFHRNSTGMTGFLWNSTGIGLE